MWFEVNTIKVKNVLKHAMFPGRMQKLKINNKTVIIDGAHNPQKMAMFIKNLTFYLPQQKFTFMLAFRRKAKIISISLQYIIPIAQKIIVTSFFNQTRSQGVVNIAEKPHIIAIILNNVNFRNYCICKNSGKALTMLLQDKKTVGVITGIIISTQ